MLTELVHCLCQLSAFLLDLSSCLYDLLVQDLVTVCEIGHPGAENHRVLVHVHSNLAFLCHQLNYRLAIFRFFEHFVSLIKLFQVLDFQEIYEAD